ncbi:MAG: glycosyltransferase family 39 protein [Bacteroidales bacterium]|nr:glycosyltransferase family 39 protein [Bacteroidales bacterium]
MEFLNRIVKNKPLVLTLFLVLVGGLYLFALGGSLNSIVLRGEEPRRGIVALEMIMNKNYVVPTIHGFNYYNKPPLFNWLIIFFSKIFHSFDNWTVRIPSVISFLLIGLLNFVVVKKYLGKKVALFSTLFFYTCFELFYYGSVYSGEIDLFYSLLVFAQALTIFHFGTNKKYFLMFFISYLLTAAGILTKGIPSLAFQAFTLVALIIVIKKPLLLLNWRHFISLGIMIALVGLYFYVYSQHEDPLPYLYKLFDEAAEKTADRGTLLSIIISTATFPVVLLRILLPWCVFLLFFDFKFLKKVYTENIYVRFTFWFFILNIPIYWINPEVRLRYLYMFIPFLFTVIALLYNKNIESRNNLTKIIFILFGIICVLIPIVFIVSFFIQFAVDIPNKFLLLIIFLIISIPASLYYFIKNSPKIYIVLFLLVITRVYMNTFYYPDFQARYFAFRNFIDEVKNITKEEPVYLTGDILTKNVGLKYAGIILSHKRVDIDFVPLLPYQVPFYLSLSKNSIMKYKPKPGPDFYYISTVEYVEGKSVEIFAKTPLCKGDCEGYVLFKLKPQEF